MSYYTLQTEIVDLGEGNSVTIKKLNHGESTQVISRSYFVSEGRVFSDGGKFMLERMKLSITAWTGPGFDDRPVTSENIEGLPQKVAARINDAIAKLNSSIDDDEGNASGAATN